MRPILLDHNALIYQSIHYYLILSYAFELLGCAMADSTEDNLDTAKKLFSAGRYSDALPYFHEAINTDPSNYLTYFKRATVFLALNRHKSALDDLNKALSLKPTFTSALSQRAGLHLKMGNLDEAQIDYERLLSSEPDNTDALVMSEKINAIRNDILNVQDLIQDNQHDVALNSLISIIEFIPYSTDLLKLRATAFEKVGNVERAIVDYKTVAKLTVDAATYLTIAKLCYKLGEVQDSLNNVRECLKLDPDHKSCMDFYKPLKKLNNHMHNMVDSKDSKDHDDCFSQGKNALKVMNDSKLSPLYQPLVYSVQSVMCRCMSQAGEVSQGLEICDEALENSESGGIEGIAVEKADLICDKADLLAEKEDYSEALKLFQESHKLKQSKRAREGVEKMKRLQKQSKKRDYYKILGVGRSADESEINRAYRKLAAKWHPDRHQDEKSKKEAQAKFMDIADAKAVLSDPQKRQQYDRGEDPLDPESKQQSHHGFHGDPFAHFGGGGSPFTFKFNFGM